MVLRDFQARDQQAVRDLILAGMRVRWAGQFDPSANPDLDDLWTNYIARGGEIVVFEENHAIVGTGTLLPDGASAGRILRMSVDRQHRRRGLARMIVRELVERARRRDWDALFVTTDTPWSDAVALYTSCGFEVVTQTDLVTHFSMRLFGDDAQRTHTSRSVASARSREPRS